MARIIEGNWDAGVVLDVHTVESHVAGHDAAGDPIFDTIRTALGEMMFRLKYRHDASAVEGIVAAAAGFLMPHRHKLDVVVPVPASQPRAMQPVEVIARGISWTIGVRFADCMWPKRPPVALKAVEDPDERKRLLAGLYAVDATATSRKNVLLVDDIYRSGATLTAATDVLRNDGHAASVRVLAITQTRSRR